jgi:pimeloyl-ACP methyl ester carboxylesterase
MTPTDKYLNANGLRFHLRDWGGGRPDGGGRPVILVHGLASNAKIWDWVAPLVAESHRVVALDQRSHGLSQPPSGDGGGFGFDSVCADLQGVVAELNFEKPIIVGHSWGASVALEYAARYPDAIGGAVLVDGGFLTLGKRMTWLEAEQRLAPPKLAGTPLEAFRERAKEFVGAMYSEALFDIILGNFEVLPDHIIRPRLAFEDHMRIVRALWEQDAEQLYPQVHCPTLFLPCIPPEPHDEMAVNFLYFKHEGAALAERLLPGAKVEWLPDSIHDVPLQRPEVVAMKIVEFVRSLG